MRWDQMAICFMPSGSGSWSVPCAVWNQVGPDRELAEDKADAREGSDEEEQDKREGNGGEHGACAFCRAVKGVACSEADTCAGERPAS
ncbi:hypothetical protein OPT61_g10303 [Boeremia exigua]|uniref:Uncharacterized protein n=1 Tax=Boeremia exigua TaxID=749465 RepID=A0ACC2HQJ2_9PLEO|nr:hypothetical protein OPT61_g10303 [Boeremia exigua]